MTTPTPPQPPTTPPPTGDTSLHMTRTNLIVAALNGALTLWPAEQAIEHAHGKSRIVAEADALEKVVAILQKANVVGQEIVDAIDTAMESLKVLEGSLAGDAGPGPHPATGPIGPGGTPPDKGIGSGSEVPPQKP